MSQPLLPSGENDETSEIEPAAQAIFNIMLEYLESGFAKRPNLNDIVSTMRGTGIMASDTQRPHYFCWIYDQESKARAEVVMQSLMFLLGNENIGTVLNGKVIKVGPYRDNTSKLNKFFLTHLCYVPIVTATAGDDDVRIITIETDMNPRTPFISGFGFDSMKKDTLVDMINAA